MLKNTILPLECICVFHIIHRKNIYFPIIINQMASVMKMQHVFFEIGI
jgi:hypothetical protein